MLINKNALLLDMNSTFMFGEDRFSADEDYSVYFSSIGGKLPDQQVNDIIRAVYQYLDERYPDEKYHCCFPSARYAIEQVTKIDIGEQDIEKIVDTFSFYEHGFITEEYVDVLHELSRYFKLSLVIDIWSPKDRWLATFAKLGIQNLFSAASFSSDHGIVKPSLKPFEMVRKQLTEAKRDCLVIGDSVRRDLGGALAAGIDCILVNGANDPRAIASYPDLLVAAKELIICQKQ